MIVFSPTDELSKPDNSNPLVFISDVPSVYLTRMDNPVESKLSPERNSVFSGNVLTSISDTSTTVTAKLAVRVLARTVGAL